MTKPALAELSRGLARDREALKEVKYSAAKGMCRSPSNCIF